MLASIRGGDDILTKQDMETGPQNLKSCGEGLLEQKGVQEQCNACMYHDALMECRQFL